jgi:hypothetical protein
MAEKKARNKAAKTEPALPQGSPAPAPIEPIPVPIEWRVGSEVVTRFASNILVQCQEHETIIAFFELKVPFIVGPREQQVASIGALATIPADCVARIAIPTSRLQEVIDTMKQGQQNYMDSRTGEMP